VYEHENKGKKWDKLTPDARADQRNHILAHTTYLTIPRGGHEVMGQFAYANGITDKALFPSDIEYSPEPTDDEVQAAATFITHHSGGKLESNDASQIKMLMQHFLAEHPKYAKGHVGTTWLDESHPIERVAFIDDTLQSGAETRDAVSAIREKFSDDVPLYTVHVARRPISETDGDAPIPENQMAAGILMSGPAKFAQRFNDLDRAMVVGDAARADEARRKLNRDWVTVVFPHACSDTPADAGPQKLLRDNRCDPLRRIARGAKGKKKAK
jgi:hypothetical protein